MMGAELDEYVLPAVTRDDKGNPVPASDPTWSPLEALRWYAGLVAHDTGARIRLFKGEHRYKSLSSGSWITKPDMVNVIVDHSSTVVGIQEARILLNGVAMVDRRG